MFPFINKTLLSWVMASQLILQTILPAIPTDLLRAAKHDDAAAAEEAAPTQSHDIDMESTATAFIPPLEPNSIPRFWHPADEYDYLVMSEEDVRDDDLGDGDCTTSTTSAAEGKCTLRAAIEEANHSNNLGEQVIALPRGTYKLTLTGSDDTAAAGDLDILDSLVIIGQNARHTVIDAGWVSGGSSGVQDRVFHIRGSTSRDVLVEIRGVTIKGGNTTTSGGGIRLEYPAVCGGACGPYDTQLTLDQATVADNTTTNNGGGIYAAYNITSTDIHDTTLIVKNSTISGNKASNGGGLFVDEKVDVTIKNTTFSGNDVTSKGGAIALESTGSGSSYQPDITLTHGTVIDNTAVTDGGAFVKLGSNSLAFTIKNTVIGKNYTGSSGTTLQNCSSSLAPTFTGNSLLDDTSCGAENTNRNVETNINFLNLEDNGGPTRTHFPLSTSAAINGATQANCDATAASEVNKDQRGFHRRIGEDGTGSGCDIGAVDREPFPERSTYGSGLLCQNFGCAGENFAPGTQGYGASGTVNSMTGNAAQYMTDLSVPSQFGAINFSRSYSSMNAYGLNQSPQWIPSGVMSKGWNHNYEARLITSGYGSETNKIIIFMPDGSRIGFDIVSAGNYAAENGVNGTLTRASDGSGGYNWTYSNAQGSSYTFRNDGRVTKIDNGFGQELTVAYKTSPNDHQIDTVTDPHGNGLKFHYDSQGRVDYVGDHTFTYGTPSTGRYVQYEYDGTTGNLEIVHDLRGKTWEYRYEENGHPYLLTKALGPVVYDGSQNPVEQPLAIYDYNTSSGPPRVEYFYNGANESTSLSAFGSGAPQITDGTARSVTHSYNLQKLLTSASNAVSDTTSFIYDPNLRVSRMLSDSGHLSEIAWSPTGEDMNAIFNAMDEAVDFHYDERHRIEDIIYADGTRTHFIYNCSEVNGSDVAGEDPFTETTIGRCDASNGESDNLLVMRIDNFVEPDLVPDPQPHDMNLKTRYEYYFNNSPQPDNMLKKVTPPTNLPTCYEYNTDGLVSKVSENCDSNLSITYVYDNEGRALTETMLPTTDTDHTVTKYEYLDQDNAPDRITTNYSASKQPYEDGVYNLVTRIYRDEQGRIKAVVLNYKEPPSVFVGELLDLDGDNKANDSDDPSLVISPDAPEYNQIKVMHYDSAGRVSEVIENYWPSKDPYYLDVYNRSTRYHYDQAGRPVLTINNYKDLPGISPSTVDLDPSASRTVNVAFEMSTSYPQFNQMIWSVYDDAGRLVLQRDSAWPGQADYYQNGTYNLVTAFQYDTDGQVVMQVRNFDPNLTDTGSVTAYTVTTFTLDASLIVDPDTPDKNIITCIERDDAGRPEYVRDACVPLESVDDFHDTDTTGTGMLYNVVTRFVYDENGRPIARIRNYDENGGQSEDEDTLQLLLTSTRNFITRVYYDEVGRVKFVVDNFSGNVRQEWPEVYDPDDPTSSTDTFATDRNLTTKYVYSSDAFLIAVIVNYWNPDGAGELTTTEIATDGYPDLNRVTRFYYNTRGLVGDEVMNLSGYDLYSANTANIPYFSTTNPDINLRTTTTYDDYAQPLTVTEIRDTSSSAHLQRQLTATYDPLGRVLSMIENDDANTYNPGAPVDVTTQFTYNLFGQQSTITRVNPSPQTNRVMKLVYDATGRVVDEIIDPNNLALTTTTDYDPAGRPIQVFNPANESVKAEYDARNQITKTTADPTGLALSTSAKYDLLGNVTEVTHEDGNTKTLYKYDNWGRLIEVHEGVRTGSTPSITTYIYDAAGNLTKTILGNGKVTTWAYDGLGRVIEERIAPDTASEIETEYVYDALNLIKVVRDPGGAEKTITYTYDALSRVTNINYSDSTSDVTYSYDSFGNRKTMVDGNGTWDYDYNGLGQLTSVTDPHSNEVTYDYNKAGERISMTLPITSGTTTLTYAYDTAGRLDTVTDPFGGSGAVVDYQYDLASRITGVALNNGVTTSYTYDNAGRLTKVANGTLSSFTYSLDALGNRVDVQDRFGSGSGSGGQSTIIGSLTSPQTKDEEPVFAFFAALVHPANSSQTDSDAADAALPDFDFGKLLEINPMLPQPVKPLPVALSSIPANSQTDEVVADLPTPTVGPARSDTSTGRQSEPAAQPVAATTTPQPATPEIVETLVPTVQPTQSPAQNGAASRPSGKQGEFVVTSAADDADAQPGDGKCENTAGICTLRAALEEANALPDENTITFAFDGDTSNIIRPAMPLPVITAPVVIDGTGKGHSTEAGLVEIDGSLLGTSGSGLVIRAGNSTVRGLWIHHFGYANIHLLEGGNNRIEGNRIGAAQFDTNQISGKIGVLVESSNNLIGGRSAKAANTIIGNETGLYLYEAGAVNNRVEGNFIGTDTSSQSGFGNDIGIRITNAASNIIGGEAAAARNVIAGNDVGVYLYGEAAANNTVVGNLVGIDVTGLTTLPNRQIGIYLFNAPANQIGGMGSARNLIAGGEYGVYIRGAAAQGNRVQGNGIGVDAAGHGFANPPAIGIYLREAAQNQIGGQNGAGNHIVSAEAGIHAQGHNARTNHIEGNQIELPAPKAHPDAAPVKINQEPQSNADQSNGGTSGSGRILQSPMQHTAAIPPQQSTITLTVNDMGDTSDDDPGFGGCADSTGKCTLRAAIQESNATTSGTVTIEFEITGTPPHTIQPATALPDITRAVVIDGTSDSDYPGVNNRPVVELDGGLTGSSIDGLKVTVSNVTIKGLAINDFDGNGIYVNSSSSNIVIQANFIGTSVDGKTGYENGLDGIKLDGSDSNTIGGTTTAQRNLISENGGNGINLQSGANNNTIQGNYIGINVNGTVVFANQAEGIRIDNGSNNTIGGTAQGAGNVIAGNTSDGIEISHSSSTGNVIKGNKIGTDPTGLEDMGNGGNGINLGTGTSSTTIGGSGTYDGNLISGNGVNGIRLYTTSNNTIQGNKVGTDVYGNEAIANASDGIEVTDGKDNTVGGTASGQSNLVSGNTGDGIHLSTITIDSGDGSPGIVIQGNLIGTNADQTAKLPNSGNGVYIHSSSQFNIGGSTSGAGNIIAGNAQNGVYLVTSSQVSLYGNQIGISASGEVNMGNGERGIYLSDSTNNVIGGTSAGQANTIANQTNPTSSTNNMGVYVNSGSTGNSIVGNSIYNNDDLGIDLVLSDSTVGVTANDTDDPDTGANALQNYPVITSASTNGTTTTISGTLNSTASTTFTIHFYANATCDASGNGEGRVYLGSDTVTTDAGGDGSFSETLSIAVGPNAQITATATSPSGNTSEFSLCKTAQRSSNFNWHYEYDALSRLTGACSDWNALTSQCKTGGTVFIYAYDAAGNLTRFDYWNGTGISTIRYAYNDANQIACIESNTSYDGDCLDGETAWEYDEYGNLTWDTVRRYQYDADMRLTSVCVGSASTCTGTETKHTYNGDGDRVQQEVVGTSKTWYLLDVNRSLPVVLNEYSVSGSTLTLGNRYLHGSSLVAQRNGSTTRYLLPDGLGTVRQLANGSGSSVATQTFDPYGNKLASTGTDTSAYGFTGEYTDSSTNLLYLRARYYTPAQGRFFQQDPHPGIGTMPQTQNPYGYVSGNPVLYGDPSGKFLPLLIGGLVIGAVAMGTWNLMVEQGKGGIDNVTSGNVFQSEHYSDVDWGQVGERAIQGGTLGSCIATIGTCAKVGGALVAEEGLRATAQVAASDAGLYGPERQQWAEEQGAGYIVQKMGDAVGLAPAANLAVGLLPGGAAGKIIGGGLATLGTGAHAIQNIQKAQETGDPFYYGEAAISAAEMVGSAAFMLKGVSDLGCSFSADTPVETSDGSEPISEIDEGDYVLAYNEETEELGYYPVTAVWAHVDPVTINLTIDGELIETTPEHPFYTAEGEWVAASDLKFGDEIRQSDGTTGTVESIVWIVEDQTMYNFTVDVAHTYFVGEGQWLVHNQCPELLEGVVDSHTRVYRLNRSYGIQNQYTPNHMPAHAYMRNTRDILLSEGTPVDYSFGKGLTFNMSVPRHLLTQSHSHAPNYSLSPRDALASDIWEARSIYRSQGLYGSQVRNGLLQFIDESLWRFPEIFTK